MFRVLIAFLMLFSSACVSQVQPLRISLLEAEKHLKEPIVPRYPTDAALARIQGIVLLEVDIDGDGNAAVRRVITGHPLLVDSARYATNEAHFVPFIVDGRRVPVRALVAVPFGRTETQLEFIRREIAFQELYWSCDGAASAALHANQLKIAELTLSRCDDVLAQEKTNPRSLAHASLLMLQGDYQQAQGRDSEAERLYRQALLFYATEAIKKDPSFGDLNAALGRHYKSHGNEVAAMSFLKAASKVYENKLKELSRKPTFRSEFGIKALKVSSSLVELAKKANNSDETKKNCQAVLQLQQFASDAELGILEMCRNVKN